MDFYDDVLSHVYLTWIIKLEQARREFQQAVTREELERTEAAYTQANSIAFRVEQQYYVAHLDAFGALPGSRASISIMTDVGFYRWLNRKGQCADSPHFKELRAEYYRSVRQ